MANRPDQGDAVKQEKNLNADFADRLDGVIKPIRWEDNFTTVSNDFARSTAMSPFTKATLLEILSHDRSWGTSIGAIMANQSCGRDKARSVISEGQADGFVYAHRIRDKNGKITGCTYHVSGDKDALRKFVINNRLETDGYDNCSQGLKNQALADQALVSGGYKRKTLTEESSVPKKEELAGNFETEISAGCSPPEKMADSKIGLRSLNAFHEESASPKAEPKPQPVKTKAKANAKTASVKKSGKRGQSELDLSGKFSAPPVAEETVSAAFAQIDAAMAGIWPRAASKTTKRKAAMRSLISAGGAGCIGEIAAALGDANFARGENDRGWIIGIDDLLFDEDKRARLLEGKYRSKKPAGPSAAESAGSEEEKIWRSRLKTWIKFTKIPVSEHYNRATGVYMPWSSEYGPRPGEDGFNPPAAIAAEFPGIMESPKPTTVINVEAERRDRAHARMKVWTKGGCAVWPDAWGPKPWEPGCLIPEDILSLFSWPAPRREESVNHSKRNKT